MDTTAAVQRLVQEYGERAFQFAFRLTGNIEDARDLVQESFHRVLKSWARYDPAQPLDRWFFAILKHLYLDGARQCARAGLIPLEELSGPDDAGRVEDRLEGADERALDLLERKESAQVVRRALRALSAEHRAALTLCDMEGLSYEEIAEVLGCPVGTVRSRVSRARNALRERLLQVGAEVLDGVS